MTGDDNKLERRRAAVRKWFDSTDLARSMPRNAQDIVERICDRIVDHGESLQTICAPDPTVKGAPTPATLLFWRRADPRINAAIHAARAAAAEVRWAALEERIQEEFESAAQTGDKGYILSIEKKMRLLYDMRKFEVAKLLPSIYGEKGAGGGAFNESKTIAERGPQVLEVPSKVERPDNLPVHKDAKKIEKAAKKGVVIDLPTKGGSLG